MHQTSDLLKARFETVRRDYDRILEQLDDKILGWRPAYGTKTIREQLLEIADKEREVIKWLRTGTWPDDDPQSFREDANLATIKNRIAELRVDTYTYIDSLNEAELNSDIELAEKWWEAMGLDKCPQHEILRNVAVHEWYHTAQLVTYLWILGKNQDS